jgi:hypothetical protein
MVSTLQTEMWYPGFQAFAFTCNLYRLHAGGRGGEAPHGAAADPRFPDVPPRGRELRIRSAVARVRRARWGAVHVELNAVDP